MRIGLVVLPIIFMFVTIMAAIIVDYERAAASDIYKVSGAKPHAFSSAATTAKLALAIIATFGIVAFAIYLAAKILVFSHEGGGEGYYE